jgi:hypothetical protein
MEVKIGQQVLAPNPDGEGMIKATVVGIGEQTDAVEIMIEGKPVKRDVAFIRYDEGKREGTADRCRYDLLKPL